MSYKYSSDELEKKLNAQEQLIRERKKKSFYEPSGFWRFCQWWDSDFFSNKKTLLKEFCDVLENAYFGKDKNIIVSVFPRFGKSYTTSLYCAWLFGYDPKITIMRNCATDILANDLSMTVREVIRSDRYQDVFPEVRLSKIKKAVSAWMLKGANELSYIGSGVGGQVTGRGVNGLIITDDLIKDSKEAMSENVLDNIWAWYLTTHSTREDLKSNIIRINIGTRWTPRDVIGRLLSYEPNKWKEFIFPAMTDDDKSTCEAMITTQQLKERRNLLVESGLSNFWEAMYMCNAKEREGVLLKKESIKRFTLDELDSSRRDGVIAFMDFADRGTDYLSMPIAEVHGNDVFVIDVVFSQSPVEVTKTKVINAVVSHRINKLTIESNNGGRVFASQLRQELDSRGCSVTWKHNSENKGVRIDISSGHIKNKFYFLEDKEQNMEYRKFFKQFTSYNKQSKNKWDDAIDSLAGLSTMVSRSQGIKLRSF